MNDMNFSQAAAVLTEIVKQATGQTPSVPITKPEDFVSVAQTALKTGYDPIINSVSQIWSRTVFAVRTYNSPLLSLEMSLPRYGNALRKLSPVAAQMSDDLGFKYPVAYDSTKPDPFGDGQSVDMWKIAKQKTLQTNFYGTAVYNQRFTIFKDQFDAAFSSADEFSRFNGMNLQERNNDRESYVEAIARGMQANFVGALIDEGNPQRVIHLLTEYKAQTGLTALTDKTVYQPENFAPFMRWVYARIKTLSRMMGERSEMYQTIVNNQPVLRHTRPDNMRIALYAPAMDQMRSMVLADTFNDEYLKTADYEAISFWQSIKDPGAINIQPVYTDAAGIVKKAAAPVAKTNVFGLLHDKDALGYALVNTWSAVTPLNIDGGYWNEGYHATVKTIQDNTEKAIVLLLD